MTRYIFFLALFLTTLVRGQVRKYSNEFLNIGVGARALSMANANIASTDGVYAGYWNPSALASQKADLSAALMHAEYFAGIAKFDYAGISKRIDTNSVVGLTMVRFGLDNILNTIDLVDANGNIDYSKISTFNIVDFAGMFNYARIIRKVEGLEVGGSVKVIRRTIGSFGGAWGFGVDAAARYAYKKWKFAAVGRDITGTFNAWSYNLTQSQKEVFAATGNVIPVSSVEITAPRLILGAAYPLTFWKKRLTFLTEVNLINTFDGKRNTVLKSNFVSLEPAFGFELGYKGIVYIRGGIGNIQQQLNERSTYYVTTAQPNFGVGIKYKIFSLDYAITDIGDRSVALYSNIFSLKIDFNRKKT